MFVGQTSPNTYEFDTDFGTSKLIYVPTPDLNGVTHIPALFSPSEGNNARCFIIHFHGNACNKYFIICLPLLNY